MAQHNEGLKDINNAAEQETAKVLLVTNLDKVHDAERQAQAHLAVDKGLPASTQEVCKKAVEGTLPTAKEDGQKKAKQAKIYKEPSRVQPGRKCKIVKIEEETKRQVLATAAEVGQEKIKTNKEEIKGQVLATAAQVGQEKIKTNKISKIPARIQPGRACKKISQ